MKILDFTSAFYSNNTMDSIEEKEGNILFNDTLNTIFNSYMEADKKMYRKEGNILFNDTLNTF